MTPYSGGEIPQKEMEVAFANYIETQHQRDIAREIYEVVREINMSKLCGAEKGYLEAVLILVAGMIGGECLFEVKRRLREDASRK